MPIPKAVFSPALDEARGPVAGAIGRFAASALTAASVVLARLADSLAEPAKSVDGPLPRLEFHAEAGTSQGAIYLDGEWVGSIPGVTRL